MILRPNHYYSFLREDTIRYKKEREDNIEYPYIGEILSDSWGDGKEPKDKLLWDEDWNSGDFWKYEDIYPELLDFINASIKEGYNIYICETVEDSAINPNDYIISDSKEIIIKMEDDPNFSEEDKNFIMSSHYSQFFAYMNRPILTETGIAKFKGTPYFGDKIWKIGDLHLYCFIETKNDDLIDLLMVQLGSSNIKDIEKEYEYVRMCERVPVFKLKTSMKYTLVLRYFVNNSEPARFTAENGEITKPRYAGMGMWVEPQGVFNSIEECLNEAENKFKEAGCNFKRVGERHVEESN
jgi:hypothetical protein